MLRQQFIPVFPDQTYHTSGADVLIRSPCMSFISSFNA